MTEADDGGTPRTFGTYKPEAPKWVSLASGTFYPDTLKEACELYGPVIKRFGELLIACKDSVDLFMKIADESPQWNRIQLARVFKKYVSPSTPVEMLKKKRDAEKICNQFGGEFRPLAEVRGVFDSRPHPDEALCALLWEYKDRGKKGYDLTERFFELVRKTFPEMKITGPERAGQDILMKELHEDYPNPNRPVDFVIWDGDKVLAIGLARYDSDRGGAQEDDRTGGYNNCANELLTYSKQKGLGYKVIFLNDGPGLLLGSMWDDYDKLEQSFPGRILVATLKMIPVRLTEKWLKE
jgi:hypothetical protein